MPLNPCENQDEVHEKVLVMSAVSKLSGSRPRFIVFSGQDVLPLTPCYFMATQIRISTLHPYLHTKVPA